MDKEKRCSKYICSEWTGFSTSVVNGQEKKGVVSTSVGNVQGKKRCSKYNCCERTRKKGVVSTYVGNGQGK